MRFGNLSSGLRHAALAAALLPLACGPARTLKSRLFGQHGGKGRAAPGSVDATPNTADCRVAPAKPKSIADFVQFLNTLPHPVTVPCVLEALAHPLSVNATGNSISAQPGAGPDYPRIFIDLGPLIVSVATSGAGAAHIELAETTTPERSIKGDLAFPLQDQIAHSAPYGGIIDHSGESTNCGTFCHGAEAPAGTKDGVTMYASDRIRPKEAHAVTVEHLTTLRQACAGPVDERCRILIALFGPEQKIGGFDFPASIPTF